MQTCLLICSIGLALGLSGPARSSDIIFADRFEASQAPESWNDTTCQYDDDGSSTGLGELEVSSLVLAEDSDPGDNIDDGTTVYFPSVLETSDCAFRLVGWGNGTTGSGGAHYPEYFHHLASHGFVVAVAHTNLAAAANPPILTSIDLVLAENSDPASVFHQKIAPSFGLMGKSQGAIAVARELSDPRSVAGALIGSGSGTQFALTKPGLFATGDSDFLQQSVINAYDLATGEAVFAQAMQPPNPPDDPAAGHMDLDDRTGVIELATSFMRCHLRGDPDTCGFVACESCQTEPWSDFRTKNIIAEP